MIRILESGSLKYLEIGEYNEVSTLPNPFHILHVHIKSVDPSWKSLIISKSWSSALALAFSETNEL